MRTSTRLTVVAGVALSLACASVARAADPPGTYVVSACRTINGPSGLAGWYPVVSDMRYALNSCGEPNGQFGLVGYGHGGWYPGEANKWVWDAPPDLVVTGVRLWRDFGISAHAFGYAFTAG